MHSIVYCIWQCFANKPFSLIYIYIYIYTYMIAIYEREAPAHGLKHTETSNE